MPHDKLAKCVVQTNQLTQENEFLRTILNALDHPFYVIDAETYRVVLANDATTTEPMSADTTCYALTHKRSEPCHTDPNFHGCPLVEVRQTGKPASTEHIHLDAEGNERYYRVYAYPMFDQEGQLRQIVESNVDITAEKLAGLALAKSEQKFRLLTENSSDMIAIIDSNGVLSYVSPAVERVLGVSAEEICGQRVDEWLHPTDRDKLQRTWADLLGELSDGESLECRVRHVDGSWRRIQGRARNLMHEDSVQGIAVNCTDLTERRRVEDLLEHSSRHDTLTGLPNRLAFRQVLVDLTERSGSSSLNTAVVHLDIDRFSVVNESLGQAVGDQLLTKVARRLESHVRGGDFLARGDGDGFLVILPDVRTVDAARSAAERVLHGLDAPFGVSGRTIHITASAGVALLSRCEDDCSPDVLLRSSQIALARAKENGVGAVDVFKSPMHQQVLRRVQIESDLRAALLDGQLHPFYQPIIELGSGAIVGFEALVRWIKPDGAIVAPGEFIQVAEDTGLIVPIDRHICRLACAQAADWQRKAGPGRKVTINVNLSPKDFEQDDLRDEIEAVLVETGLPAECLKLELTERLLMGRGTQTTSTLTGLKELGVRLCLDDFGTGYSSLSCLHDFPIDCIKIDRSFISRLAPDERPPNLVSTMVELAQQLEMTVVAEGIENAEQLAFLTDVSCGYGQGFYFARPVPADRAGELLNTDLPAA